LAAITTAPKAPVTTSSWRRFALRLLSVVGPGMIVAFADTEAGSVTTAA